MEQILDAPIEQRKITEYAGFWIRTAAILIDAVILAAVQWILLELLSPSISFSEGGRQTIANVVSLIYYVAMESSAKQGTIGKIAVGIKVGDAEGNQLSWPNVLGRYFAKILSAIILLIGFIMVAFDDKKQGLHDKLASTYVFYKD